MARNYSLPTVKTLFAEANACAYPACDEPLIFHDRGLNTVTAEIAHIRSESDLGPRFDADFDGDLNGPENLLLLCGRHHRPVDRHEVAYSVDELVEWKAAQIARAAGQGTEVSEADVRALVGMSPETGEALTTLARLIQRVVSQAQAVHNQVKLVRARAAEQRASRNRGGGMMFQLDEEGGQGERIDVPLSSMEEHVWRDREAKAWGLHQPQIDEAWRRLEEEVAVLVMVAPALATHAYAVLEGVVDLLDGIGDSERIEAAAASISGRVRHLWQSARGEID